MEVRGFRIVPPLGGVLVRRSAEYWVLVHVAHKVAIAAMAAMGGAAVPPELLFPGSNPLTVGVVVALGAVESRWRNEDLFLANLGYGWATRAAYVALPAATLEVAFTVGRLGWG